MSPSTIVIRYQKQGTVPPVFVAGSFSSTQWEVHELVEDDDHSGSFSGSFSVSPGTYQYKFRLGPGDWWVVDEALETGQYFTLFFPGLSPP
jgi:Glycogen recognition site of AMP-activated protein kinase